MAAINEKYLENIVRGRLADYRRKDPAQERAELVELWRKSHPEAAHEASSWNKPLILVDSRRPEDIPEAPDEQWCNDTYFVTVRRRKEDPVFRSGKGLVQLGIAALDGTARHDWREFQAIKNQLAGDECEAFELYPAESRLLDPSNYYTIWCFPGLNRIKVGQNIRDVRNADQAIAPQRALAGA